MITDNSKKDLVASQIAIGQSTELERIVDHLYGEVWKMEESSTKISILKNKLRFIPVGDINEKKCPEPKDLTSKLWALIEDMKTFNLEIESSLNCLSEII